MSHAARGHGRLARCPRREMASFALALLVCAAPLQGQQSALPASLSNQESWALTERLSEPDAYFRSNSGSTDNPRIALRQIIPALLTLVLSSTAATAQTDTAAFSIKKAAVAAFRDHPGAARSSAVASRRLVLNPIVLPLWYDNGVKREASAAPVIRDSAQSVALATAAGITVASSAETAACSSQGSRGGAAAAAACTLLDVVIVSIGEPRPVGSEALLMMRTISPVKLANGSITLSRYGSTYLVRLTRADGTWRVRCLTNLPDTSDSDPAAVAARCGPP